MVEAVSEFDGNAEQIRAFISQIVEAQELRRGGMHDEIITLKADIERDIERKIDAAVTKMKFWVISAVLTQVAAMLPVIFFLGGIYTTNTAALDSIRKLQTVLEQRGAWMSERERFEQAVEQWAEPKGYVAPRYKGRTTP